MNKLLQLISFGCILLLSVSFIIGMTGTWQSAIITYKNATLWPMVAAFLVSNGTPAAWKRLAKVAAISALGMFVLGGEQFFSSPDSWINQYAWSTAGLKNEVASFGGLGGVRATGTFSYIAGMSAFAVFSFSMCFYQVLRAENLRGRILPVAGCAAAIGCAVVSGSRAPMVLISVVVLMSALTSLKRARTFIGIVLFSALLLGVAVTFLQREMVEEYLGRWTRDPQETMQRFTNKGLRADYWEMLMHDPVGIGLGQGNGYAVFESSQGNHMRLVNAFDDGASNAIYEAGVLGAIAFVLAPCCLLVQLVLGFSSRVSVVRTVTGALGVVPVIVLIGGVWQDHNATAFTWMQVAGWFFQWSEAVRNRAEERNGSRAFHALFREPRRVW